ncbi:hypothetical protein [Actinocrispum wychmicini]|uniref:hypothetical protein n=1 Tax=Actinocrispum wychmicini TaxID=1213861 RepID=UPI001046C51E|nr:hypothetical protein [Actinocrispum wychmicini]
MAADPLRRLIDKAAAAVAHDIPFRRRTGTATEVWPTANEVAVSCASLAVTSTAERGRFRAELRDRQRAVLGRYGFRSATIALRERVPERLLIGLIAVALADDNVDPRDLMMTVAAHHYVAQQLGVEPADIFDEAASYANPDTADVLRTFGSRTDVTLRSFGLKQIDTPEGPRIS